MSSWQPNTDQDDLNVVKLYLETSLVAPIYPPTRTLQRIFEVNKNIGGVIYVSPTIYQLIIFVLHHLSYCFFFYRKEQKLWQGFEYVFVSNDCKHIKRCCVGARITRPTRRVNTQQTPGNSSWNCTCIYQKRNIYILTLIDGETVSVNHGDVMEKRYASRWYFIVARL